MIAQRPLSFSLTGPSCKSITAYESVTSITRCSLPLIVMGALLCTPAFSPGCTYALPAAISMTVTSTCVARGGGGGGVVTGGGGFGFTASAGAALVRTIAKSASFFIAAPPLGDSSDIRRRRSASGPCAAA